MKKFISMVMAAAMVVSLVPATAFASSAAIKVVGDKEYTEETAEAMKDKGTVIAGPEIQLDITDVDQKNSDKEETFDIDLTFDNAEVDGTIAKDAVVGKVVRELDNADVTVGLVKVKEAVEDEDTTIELYAEESTDNAEFNFTDDDVIVIDVEALQLVLTKDSKGTEVTVDVDGDFGSADGLVVAAVLEEGVTVTLKKVAEVAEEESIAALESKLTIEADVDTFVEGQVIEMKLSKGFEWDLTAAQIKGLEDINGVRNAYIDEDDEDTLVLELGSKAGSKIEIAKTLLGIEAVDAKVGTIGTITVKVKEGDATDAWKATAEAVDAVEVIGEGVVLSVDEDEDVPEIWSGVDTENTGLTVDDSHDSLEVTIEETVKGALDVKDDLTLTLTEGVFVTEVKVTGDDGVVLANGSTDIAAAFKAAYKEGDQESFIFDRKTFVATDDEDVNKAMELKFTMTLVAVPGFVGDAVLTIEGDAIDTQEVVIATFKAPYTVEASANDLIIDYRNTEVPTDIVITEAEAGLWEDNNGNEVPMTFDFAIDRFSDDAFEGDATYTVNEDSEMEVKEAKDGLGFTVDEVSDEEAAVVTISDIALYMGRSIAAGAYDLELGTSAALALMTGEYAELWTNEKGEAGAYVLADYADWDYDEDDNEWISEKATVKEGFVNVVTAGRDADDASFTKKVVVPVGEAYIIAGEQTVALDVPAYVSAAGYTMLPVRAVAVALGILNNNVLWDQATKTVTILYGQRIITMQVGAKVVYVNGSAIPASASPEVVDGRTFLPMRDLATALGVTDITWDAATKTATLNGNK